MVQEAATTAATIIPTPSPCGWPAAASSRGITLGETDELGFNVVQRQGPRPRPARHVLHLLGFDHTKLTYRFQGRDFRLTDVAGQVVKELLA